MKIEESIKCAYVESYNGTRKGDKKEEVELIKQTILNAKNNDKNLDTLLDKLDKYWEFVLKANIGGEFMTDESLELLEEIGNFSYESEGEKYFLLTKDEKRNLAIRKGTLLP